MPLVREISRGDRVTVGNITLFFEEYDPADRQVMLVVSDPSQPWLKRSRPYYLKRYQPHTLPNGVKVAVQHGATQKRIRLAIISPPNVHVPVTVSKSTWALARAAQKSQPPQESEESSQPVKCSTPGCFNTACGGELCDECLDGRVPADRGPVLVRELMYAMLYGGEDLAVTRERLKQNGQPDNGLY